MKGKNGLDLKIARYYNSFESNLKEPRVWGYVTTVPGTKAFVAGGYFIDLVYELNFGGPPAPIPERTNGPFMYYDDKIFNDEYDPGLIQKIDKYNSGYFDESFTQDGYLYIRSYREFSAVDTEYTSTLTSYLTKPSDSTSNDKFFSLGAGWAFDFPYVEKRANYEYLHYGSSGVWQIKITSETSDSNLKDYLLKDIVINYSTALTYDGLTSKYVIIEKDGKKIYIASDGLILGIDDRFGNTNFWYGC